MESRRGGETEGGRNPAGPESTPNPQADGRGSGVRETPDLTGSAASPQYACRFRTTGRRNGCSPGPSRGPSRRPGKSSSTP